MLKKFKSRGFISLILVFALLASLVSCNFKKSVADYLLEEDLPEFDTELFYTIEACFNSYYYTELEDAETLCKKTVDAYYEFCAEDIDTSSKDEVTYALIDCYIYAVGDLYAFYRTADEAEDYTTDMSGSFVGIGVSVLCNYLENTILVSGVEIDSPADKAGITADDYIVAVNGELVTDLGVSEAINRIKGEVGTSVNVTILRGEEEISLDMIREQITETTVSYDFLDGGKVGYIKITSFKGNTASQFINAVNALEAAGVQSVIFDLRSNPGGYLSAVVSMLSYLVPTGTEIVSFSNGKSTIYATHGETDEEPVDHVLSVPSVVLCNDSSASASELFAGAMRDYNDMGILKSTLVGEVTYKKGIMQTTISFKDNSTLTLTTALYNPPSKQNFHGVGVTPDILVNDGDDYIEIALEALKSQN